MSYFIQSLSFSKLSLRRVLLGFWFLTSASLSFLLITLDVFERYREVYFDAEHAKNIVMASHLSKIDSTRRQPLIQSYASIPHSDGLEGMNFILVVNKSGVIEYSSRPYWQGLSLSDPLFNRSETSDPVFRGLVSCFDLPSEDCISSPPPSYRFNFDSYTVALPIEIPPEDLGLSSRDLLVVVNYAPSVILSDLGQDVIFLIIVSFVLVGLATSVLAYILKSSLLPALDESSRTDGLTGLINRSLFMEQAKVLLADAEENQNDLVFVIADIDFFKKINDTYGHACGDLALAHVAQIFMTTTRPDDIVCRFGGEEFSILINGSRDAAARALERLRLQIEMAHLDFAGHRIRITSSFGAAATSDCGYNLDFLYNSADKALYAAKESGRNRVAWSDGIVASRLAR